MQNRPTGGRIMHSTENMKNSERLHPDETNAVESKAQTEHKLEVMRRYFGAFASILAQSKNEFIDNSHIWLVDLFAGAGLHKSADHPDGRVYGTALQACAAARSVQRKYPDSQVHVRLVDIDSDYCARLRERATFFRRAGVDVDVREEDYTRAIPTIVAQIRALGTKSKSLWLIDPHGLKILAFDELVHLLNASGVEIIINLDVTGVERMRGVVVSESANLDDTSRDRARKNRENLDALYRGDCWLQPEKHVRVRPGMTLEDKLAEAYLLPFRMFRFKHAYPLRSSAAQYRYLIPLTKNEKGESAFRSAYEASQKVGIAKGRALNDVACAKYANDLFEAYRGTKIAMEDAYTDHIVSLDRAQLARVLRYASMEGYGEFDDREMVWHGERQDELRLAEPPQEADRQIRLF